MARFTTRVQLSGTPTAEEFEKLHKAMKARGFSRVIFGSDNQHYWMPHAEYDRTGNLTLTQVLNDAKAAAGTVRSSYEVFVTEGGCMWYGLQKATASQAAAS